MFVSQIVQKQVKVEDISTHDVTVVPVDGGSHLRVTFAQDTPMTLDILDENGQPSQITTKKVVGDHKVKIVFNCFRTGFLQP